MHEFTSIYKLVCKQNIPPTGEIKTSNVIIIPDTWQMETVADGFFYLLGNWTVYFLTLAANQVEKKE